MSKPRIAVFSGPTATIANSAPLVTSNAARRRHGLPLLTGADGEPIAVDVLRPQRLAAPITVYVEAYTAHPLEVDATELYAAPDGWLDEAGTFSETEPAGAATPVFVVELRPEDGLVPLPYLARQADGSAWEDTTAYPFAPQEQARQTFYPDASRIFEEIERLGIGGDGRPVALTSVADFDFVRAIPPGGWKHGRAEKLRSDLGQGDIEPEVIGEDFFGYYPHHLHREPTLRNLARATNLVQRTLDTGDYVGAQWLEGSPTTEETMYWLNLLIDTRVPLVGHSAQRPHGTVSADGDRNIIDGVGYLVAGLALDAAGNDRVGAVMIVDEMAYSARDITKTDARPGGYQVTGGHGGVVADLGGGGAQLTYLPDRRHTATSAVRLSELPTSVTGVTGAVGSITTVEVRVKDDTGDLLAEAMPQVTFTKFGRYLPSGGIDPDTEVEVLTRIEANLAGAPLSGFVAEGMSPYGTTGPANMAALHRAVFSGMPVVRVGRGNTGGKAYDGDPLTIPGNNLTATKARILLMACLLRLGALPVAADPANPTDEDRAATMAALESYREIFATH